VHGRGKGARRKRDEPDVYNLEVRPRGRERTSGKNTHIPPREPSLDLTGIKRPGWWVSGPFVIKLYCEWCVLRYLEPISHGVCPTGTDWPSTVWRGCCRYLVGHPQTRVDLPVFYCKNDRGRGSTKCLGESDTTHNYPSGRVANYADEPALETSAPLSCG